MDDEPCKSPYPENTSDGEDWIRGWQRGHGVMTEIVASREEPAAELIKGSDGEDLDDEQDAA